MAGIFLPGTSKGGDISGVTAGVGLSGGGDSGGVTLTLDLSELSAVVPTSGDWFGTLDSDDANEQLTTTDALATLFAGDGLTASSAVLAVNVDDSTIETDSDAIRIKDNGVSLAKMAGLTRGSIIYGDTSGDPAALAKGSADYVLTSDGTDIAWAAAGAGAVTALNNATANEIVTVGSTTTELDAESTLTFASSKLIPTATAHDAAGTALTMSAGATTAGTTNNIAGGALTFQGGQGKGSGAGGSIVFQTANAAGSGSSLNALATALTIEDDLNATFGNDVLLNTDSAVIKMGVDADATFTHDGTTGLTVAANPFEVDSGGNITLDAHTGIFIFQDANTEVLRITEGNSGDVTIKLETNAKDLIFTDNGDAVGLTVKDAAAGIVVPGEVMTTKISYTDGDDAITIADTGLTTFAQNVAVADSKFIEFESAAGTPTTDNTVQGVVIEFLAVEAITQFDAVYVSTTTGRVGRADANDAAKLPAIGIAIEAQGSAGSSVRVLTHGVYRDDGGFGGNMTVGVDLYVSETPGTLTTTAPGDDGDFVQVMGVAIGVRSAFINPDLTMIEHA